MLRRHTLRHAALSVLLVFSLSGCIGTVVGAAVDVAVEVVKVPFKVAGAVVDAVKKDDLADGADGENFDQVDSDEAARRLESQGLQ